MRLGLVALAVMVALACRGKGRSSDRSSMAGARAIPKGSASAIASALGALREEEAALRARTRFETQPPSSRSLGANPYAIRELEGAHFRAALPAARYAALLRGDSRIVLLDATFAVIASLPGPRSPSALGVGPDGRFYVVGPLEDRVARFSLREGELVEEPSLPVKGGAVPRALAIDDRALVVADFANDRMGALSRDRAALSPPPPIELGQSTCRGPFRVVLTPSFAGVLCLFDHGLSLVSRGADGLLAGEVARITHDGPLWGFSLLESPGELLIAVGGVEDRPLDRRDKAFGYVDSFVDLYRLDSRGASPNALERLFTVNTSEHGVLTPKVLDLAKTGASLRLEVLGYGSDRRLVMEADTSGKGEPRVQALPGLPGCTDAARSGGGLVCANPLFDAFVEVGDRPVIHAARKVESSDPTAREKLGEALFFTGLMAPDASSTGKLSRFTCETCHFEGGTDGRVHHSGRGDIRVSTRPLYGLLNDAPHFSRAHDRDLTAVCHNEFAVANRGNPVDPWFTLTVARYPWLASLGVTDTAIAPIELRRALLEFLARFSHEENPWAVKSGRAPSFSENEQAGARVFRARCAGCHAARLVAADAATEVPFESWAERVLSPSGPIVWARADYEKTGVLPYVDPKGTRIPSLRRLYVKRPYLTRGSARTLSDVLAQARFSEREFFHAAGENRGDLRALSSEERAQLLAFLTLL
jgi:hypothetical protein